MKSNIRTGLMATTTLWSLALGATVLMAGAATLAPATAEAQDYTSGALIGTVTANGAPVAGAKVTVTSKALGQSHTVTTTAKGTFSSTGLQPGDYDITVTAQGYADYHTTATVVISQEIRVEATLQSAGATTQTVIVKGRRTRQDFTKTTTGLTVDLDTLVSQEPIARNLTAVTMLAPTVVIGNPGFGTGDRAVASFGGASVAENAYYVDGLNITNPDTYISSARVPFDFYKTVEVKTGGFQAEYGRATGGVVNTTTKSGTNAFTFGVHGNYQPMNLRADQLDTNDYVGKFSRVQNNSLSVEAGGPIIKDKLFFYGLYQVNNYESQTANKTTGTYTDTVNNDPFLGLKLDGYITPTQHLSLTYFDTTNTNESKLYNFDSATNTVGASAGSSNEELGGKNWVFNYNGKVNDGFSVSAAVGDMKDRDNIVPSDTTSYYVRTYAVDGTYSVTSPQKSSGYSIDDMERKFWRADGDVRFDFAGHHHIRFGIDHEKNSELKTTKLSGTQPVQYRIRNYDSNSDGVADYQRLQVIYENLGGNVSSENQALYLQDSWDITPNFNLQIGVRDDQFKQFNLSGQKYMDLTGNVAPRLGFAWTPDADGKLKISGSLGSNYIPPAMNLGFRGKDLYYTEYFAPSSGSFFTIDSATGLPTSVGAAILNKSGYSTACPASTLASAPGFNSSNAAAGTLACVVYGNGTQEGATSKTSVGLKATRSDEAQLGFNYRFNDLWSGGITATYRNLKNISEDSDFNDAIISYLSAKGLDTSQWVGGSSYYVWNVGDHDVTIQLKNILPGETTARTITLTADQLGHYHDAKREYKALTFDFKRAFDGKWGLQGSYVWSQLKGNYNGTVTEYGNSVQTDAGATYAWDSPGMENYGSGILPGNRDHTVKLFGSYAVTPSLLVGANVLIQSPERFSCLGLNADDEYAYGYGDVSHYCDGKPAQLGEGLQSSWLHTIDVALRYTVPTQFAMGGKLTLRADIFNLFDQHAVLTRYVTYDGDEIGKIDSQYGNVTNYSTPRYVRVGFDLTY